LRELELSNLDTGREPMLWYVSIAHFAAGAFLANGVPHFVNGISGHRFQSPFASPPGVGESSPVVNVIWGMANFVAGYTLVSAVGEFSAGLTLDALTLGLGALLVGIGLAAHFGRVRQDPEPAPRAPE
jgi:hypothetical protein